DLADPYLHDDFQNWPVDLGAPWVDVDNDGTYSPLPVGPDHPDFIGDQVIWYVSNDGDSSGHSVFGTAPLGVEVQTTIFGFDRANVTGDILFVKELIINKGGNTIEDMYIGLWSDPDLGNAGDDFVGCDTILGMGICYNDGVDYDYSDFPGGTPAVGYDFFQGPIVPSLGDTAFAFKRNILDHRNLQMTSFNHYLGGDNPNWSDPNNRREMYNLMQGLMRNGLPFADNLTGGSRFVHPGDPTLDTGPDDTEYVNSDIHRSSDKRFLMSSGPFTMVPGDSQEVVYGIMLAADGDALDSYLYLKEVDRIAQRLYDNRFQPPSSPPVPEVKVSAFPESIILTWDFAAENYHEIDEVDLQPEAISIDTVFKTVVDYDITTSLDTVISGNDTTIVTVYDTIFIWIQEIDFIDTTFQGMPTSYQFEGYNVYQLSSNSPTAMKRRLATYDLINGIEEIYDNVFDLQLGEYINRRVQYGSDSGIRRYIEIEEDHVIDPGPFKLNRAYYFAVTAYGYNPYGVPRTLESPLNVIEVRPQTPTTWSPHDSTAVHGNDLTGDHITGNSDFIVTVKIIDPASLTGHEYEVNFSDTGSVTTWAVTDVTLGIEVSGGNTIQRGIDLATGTEVGVDANPIMDGFQI
ncbi:MAG: hypothetical protein KAK01_11030, partial [Candidatus Marinimicrobia bacterium]|nr:hypothetical protein [Candidatus Neomarinimicrobiota bacterium]